MGDRHACPDCGASHPRRAPKAVKRTTVASSTDLAATRCPRCRASVLSGRVGGFDVYLDAAPINELGWCAFRGVGREVVTRKGARARAHSPTTRWPPKEGQYFHIVHECGKTIPDLLRENNVVQRKRVVELPENPPF